MSIILRNVSKRFGKVVAVNNVSFAVHPGEVTGLLGPNGAGKTTTVRLISGFLTPSSGVIEVNGATCSRDSIDVRRQIGYLPEDNPLYHDMTVVEHLVFIAGLQGVPKGDRNRRVKEIVDLFDLWPGRHMNIGKLSRGYRKRVGLAQTLVHNPKILIFDEPTTGLDPNQIIEFRRFINELGREKTVIYCSHNLAEVQAICSRVVIMNKGRTLSDAAIGTLQQEFQRGMQYFVTIEPPDASTSPEAMRNILQNVRIFKDVTSIEPGWHDERRRSFYVDAVQGSDVVKELFAMCVSNSWTLVDVQRRSVKIEDIFHQLTSTDLS
ncbi:MAG TPA: hypothetical protein DGH68_01595 [Bacteroidetes bacterium]|nr:hypothetical protein [Bacteroidota bacterium]